MKLTQRSFDCSGVFSPSFMGQTKVKFFQNLPDKVLHTINHYQFLFIVSIFLAVINTFNFLFLHIIPGILKLFGLRSFGVNLKNFDLFF